MGKPSQRSRAYAAGFFDGEGSVLVGDESRSYCVTVSVVQKPEFVLSWLQSIWGGSIYREKGGYYRWRLEADKAATFLIDVSPYLQLKQQQALHAIRLQTLRHSLRNGSKRAVGLRVLGSSIRAAVRALNAGRS